MAKITATGKTIYGKADVKIIGSKNVEKIICDNTLLKAIIDGDIKSRKNSIANYAPPANSMLQAYATLCRYFGENNVKTDTDIVELPESDEEGAIY